MHSCECTPGSKLPKHLQHRRGLALSACLAVQLKILACNVSGGELQGTILVNGQLVHPKEFRNQSAVVWQSDVLLSSSTVRVPCLLHA